jgi:AraC family transcriptional regulator of adaptative response/methylated-DNA-[protein]-cysteine methyltransferase
MIVGNLYPHSDDYDRVSRAIRFVGAHFKSQPGLDEIARSAGLSKYHFDRLFKRWAGVSPIQFLQFLTLDYTKQQLASAASVLDAALSAGLSGPGRLHDLFVTFDAMSPGEFKKKGQGVAIEYGFNRTLFGECLLAVTPRGICHLGFVDHEDQAVSLENLRREWPRATFAENARKTAAITDRVFSRSRAREARPFHLFLRGTNFQVNVWQALLSIPAGCVCGYQDVADFLGRPTAVRAVSTAIAKNPISFLIPCHRVIKSSGKIHRYRWGTDRKKAFIGWEAAQKAAAPGQ